MKGEKVREFFARITPHRRSRSAQPADRLTEYNQSYASSAVPIQHALPPGAGSGSAPSTTNTAAVATTPTPAVAVRPRYYHSFFLRSSFVE